MKTLLALLLLLSLPVFAKEEPDASPAASASPSPGEGKSKGGDAESEEPKLSVSEHTVTIGGKAVKYKAVAGYLLLRDEVDENAGDAKKEGPPDIKKDPVKAKAKIFFISYTREEAGTPAGARPITFAFNGGPGAASVWLHLGALGPRRVKLVPPPAPTSPPYQLVDNDSSWLDDTDLVFIDPVSTGYSRPVPGESAKPFHGFEADIASIASFIRLYTTRYNRWLSPKFVVGESYGGTRAGALSDYLQEHDGIYLNGIIVVSGLLNWEQVSTTAGNDLPYLLALPTFAATAWYHKKLSPEMQAKTVDTVESEAEAFASNEYLLALSKGSAIDGAESGRIAAEVSRFTGLPADYVQRYHNRIEIDAFRRELLKTDNRTVGRYDSCYAGIVYEPGEMTFDPSFEAINGAFNATVNDYLRTELKFESDLPYQTLANVSPWDFSNVTNQYLDVSEDIGEAMSKNPHLKVWVLVGAYDLAIPYFGTEYTLRRMPLDPSLRLNIRVTKYDAGHMLYTHEDSLIKMKADLTSFMQDAIPH